jgi:uncharacterized membrane protein
MKSSGSQSQYKNHNKSSYFWFSAKRSNLTFLILTTSLTFVRFYLDLSTDFWFSARRSNLTFLILTTSLTFVRFYLDLSTD